MRMMKAFAYLGDGTAGWVEKPIPQPTGFDGVIRPLLVSPCTSDVHNVEIDCLKPGRILGHEGLGEIVAVGEGVKEFQVGEIVVVPPVTPDWRTVPSQLGQHQHCAGLITGQKLSNSEDGLLAEYALIRDLDANAARIPPGVSPEGAVMAADMLNTGLYGRGAGGGPAGGHRRGHGRWSRGPHGHCRGQAPGGRADHRHRQPEGRRRAGQILWGHGPRKLQRGQRGAPDPRADPQAGGRLLHLRRGRHGSPGPGRGMVRWGGTVGNVNYFTTYGDLPLNNVRYGFGMGNKTIRGGECPGGRARMEKLLALLQYGRVDPVPLITHRFQGLDQVETAFHLMAEKPPGAGKTIVAL